MTAQYDWSKLPDGWRYHKDARYGDEFLIETIGTGPICGEYTYRLDMVQHYSKCADVLDACRIPEPPPPADTCPNCGMSLRYVILHRCVTPPDTATVTALRTVEGENGDIIVMKGGTVRTLHTQSADEYDWSRLSPGWRFEADTRVLRHDEDWFRISTLESDTRPEDVYWQRAYVAARAQLAKCKCKRDWRDEVKQACAGHDVKVDTYPDYITIGAFLTVYPYKRMSVWAPPDAFGIGHLLRMSLIIERLKKLGWREA